MSFKVFFVLARCALGALAGDGHQERYEVNGLGLSGTEGVE